MRIPTVRAAVNTQKTQILTPNELSCPRDARRAVPRIATLDWNNRTRTAREPTARYERASLRRGPLAAGRAGAVRRGDRRARPVRVRRRPHTGGAEPAGAERRAARRSGHPVPRARAVPGQAPRRGPRVQQHRPTPARALRREAEGLPPVPVLLARRAAVRQSRSGARANRLARHGAARRLQDVPRARDARVGSGAPAFVVPNRHRRDWHREDAPAPRARGARRAGKRWRTTAARRSARSVRNRRRSGSIRNCWRR